MKMIEKLLRLLGYVYGHDAKEQVLLGWTLRGAYDMLCREPNAQSMTTEEVVAYLSERL